MKKTVRINGGSEICRSVEKSLDEYFRRLDGEQPRGIYNMVIANVERMTGLEVTEVNIAVDDVWMGDDDEPETARVQ